MPRLRHHIIARSRDRDFLLRAVLVIGVVGIALGFVGSHFGPAGGKIAGRHLEAIWFGGEGTGFEFDPEQFEFDPDEQGFNGKEFFQSIEKGSPDLESIALLIRQVPAAGFEETILGSLDAETRQLFTFYATALHKTGEEFAAARTALGAAAAEVPPPRFANEFYGHILRRADDFSGAIEHFRREVEHFPETTYSRRSEISLLLKTEDAETLGKRLDDPAYSNLLDYSTHVDALLMTGRWWQFTVLAAKVRVAHFTLAWTLITLLAGLVWFAIIALLGGIEGAFRSRLALYGTGFGLGVVSIFLHSPLNLFQSDVIGLRENGEFINDAVFYISGVGLREEFIKLLLFVPLLPLILKRRSPMEALAAAGCVGLGFAVMENLGYAGTHSEGTLFARFVTANFLHVSFTGIAGLALFHFARWPKTRWDEFLYSFIGVIIAHGLYDLFLGNGPGGIRVDILSVVIMALTVYRYLDLSIEHREGRSIALSPFGVFVVGGALVVALSWIHACWHVPLTNVMDGVGGSVLSVAAISFVFINRLRHE